MQSHILLYIEESYCLLQECGTTLAFPLEVIASPPLILSSRGAVYTCFCRQAHKSSKAT